MKCFFIYFCCQLFKSKLFKGKRKYTILKFWNMKIFLSIIAMVLAITTLVNAQTPKNHFLKNGNGTISKETTVMYNLSISTGTYTNLMEPISITNGLVWDDPVEEITLPFSFQILNKTVNSLFLNGLGGIISNVLESDSVYYIIANSADFIDRGYDNEVSVSSINHKTEGNIGSRIFKIEWLNAGSYDEGDPYTMFLNMQIWLYEGSNIIEWHYGPSSIIDSVLFYDGGTGPMMGIGIDNNDVPLQIHIIGGTALNPSLTPFLISMEGNPSNGMIYRLNPGSTSINNNTLAVTIYPNPVQNILNIETKQNNATVSIYDYTGKLILSEMISETGAIDVSNITAGIYMVKIENGGIASTQKFVKQ